MRTLIYALIHLLLCSLLSYPCMAGKMKLRENYGTENWDVVELKGGRVKKTLGDELQSYLQSCNVTLEIWPDKIINILSPYHGTATQYPPNVNCQWEVLGSPECVPEVSCEVLDLRPDICLQEFLFISDGLSSGQTFCDDQRFSEPVAGKVGDYLFIDFKTAKSTNFDRLYKGFQCTVRCKSKDTNPKHMPDLLPDQEEYKCISGHTTRDKYGRIVNGKPVEKHEIPWQVALVNTGSRKPFCGGTLINNQFIITAAHCFEGEESMAIMPDVILRGHVLDTSLRGNAKDDVPIGEERSLQGPGNHLPDDSKDEIRISVDKISIHRFFSKYVQYDSDIALLKLSKVIDLKDLNSPIPACLPTVAEMGKILARKVGTVSGWGLAHENAGSTTKVLQKLQVPILTMQECQGLYEGYAITDNMFCAGFAAGEKDACQGDSGGPLTVMFGTQAVHVGIVSWGVGCAAKKHPGVYANVANFLPWIRHKTRGSTWCARNTSSSE